MASKKLDNIEAHATRVQENDGMGIEKQPEPSIISDHKSFAPEHILSQEDVDPVFTAKLHLVNNVRGARS